MSGLQKQPFSVIFGQGLDTKSDPKLVVPGKLTTLENCVFKKGGTLSKRNGYQAVSSQITDGSLVPNADGLGKFDGELLLFGANKVYSYAESSGKWVDKGSCSSFDITTRQIVKNTYSQTQADSAATGGISVYAWEDSRGGVYASVYDESTQTPILVDQLLDASGERVRCLAFSDYLYVFYYSGGNLKCNRVNPATATAFDAAVTVSNSVNTTNRHYDVVVLNPYLMIWAHNDSSANTIRLGGLTVSLSVPSNPATITIAEAATNCLSLIIGAGQRIYAFWHNSSGLRYGVHNNGFTQILGPTEVSSYTSTTIRNVTGHLKYDGTTVQVYYEISGASSDLNYVRTTSVTSSAASGVHTTLQRGAGLWSKAWTKWLDSDLSLGTVPERGYVGIVGLQSSQETFFIMRSDGYLVAKMQLSLAYGTTSRTILANVWQDQTDVYSFALVNKFQISGENGFFYSLYGVARTSCDFTSPNAYISVQLGGNLHVGGGILQAYDGQSAVEHGFHYYPVFKSATQGTSGSMTLTGVYSYVALYEWTDNRGQRHLSPASDPYAVTLTGSNNKVTFTISTLRQTAKTGTRTAPIVSLWRTEASGTVYYRVSSTSSPTYNDPTTDTVTIEDTLADSAILSNELLYTTGGVLSNAANIGASLPALYKDRLFLAGTENKNEVYFCKPKVFGVPVEFADEFLQEVDSQGGDITALAALDDKLVYFKADRILITTGEGPNAAGVLGGYNDPQLISTDSGCTVAKSIAYLPDGIIRVTKKGIYKLNSALQNEYIGAPVEAFNSKTVTCATLKSDRNQVRFLTSDSNCLVYDYFFNQWSTFSNHAGESSLIWNDQDYVYLRNDGSVLKEVNDYYKDVDAAFQMKLITGWISLAGITGFKRIYDVTFLAEYKSTHILRLGLGYDFNDAWLNYVIFDPDASIDVTSYGEDSTYGSSGYFGGSGSSYQFKASLTQQKCTSIRLLIEEITTAATAGTQESLELTAISFLFGVKGGLQRYKASQSVGTAE